MELSVVEPPWQRAWLDILTPLHRLLACNPWVDRDWDELGLAASRLAALARVYHPPLVFPVSSSGAPKVPYMDI
jgi:hypothetical protein